MLKKEKLVDYDHPLVTETAHALTEGVDQPADKLKRIFHFVRDKILFGFPPEGDLVKASQTIERGYGQCNTKGTLMLALCKAISIPARLHFSDISKSIQRGFFQGLFYWLIPEKITHSWLEVKIDGQWHAIDTYINDIRLHKAALQALDKRGWKVGFSLSAEQGKPSATLNLDSENYSQMSAVIGDHGIWDEPANFYDQPEYHNRPGFIKRWLYRLYIPFVNWRVQKLRDNR